jgi:hypothetical protein
LLGSFFSKYSICVPLFLLEKLFPKKFLFEEEEKEEEEDEEDETESESESQFSESKNFK